MENNKVRVAITHGDTNGIGYELIFKTFAEPEMLELCTPIVYGSPKVAAYYRKAIEMPAQFSIIQKAEDAEDGRINLLAAVDEEVKVDMGMPTPESGEAAVKALDRAMTDYRNGLYDVLVTAPVSNKNAQIEGYTFHGHKNYIETCLGEGKKALSVLVGQNMRIASVTEKMPLKNVSEALTTDDIVDKTLQLHRVVKRDLLITNPRIAILAFNPTTGEDLEPGAEEKDIIIPALAKLEEQGVQAYGPYPADVFFGEGYFGEFDAVLAMYQSQAATPFHAIETQPGVLYTASLPIVRTGTDQTPCYEQAGTGEADETAFRNAVYLAIDIYRNRQSYDEAYQNPLQKLYRERREDGEKVRFSIPKKRPAASPKAGLTPAPSPKREE